MGFNLKSIAKNFNAVQPNKSTSTEKEVCFNSTEAKFTISAELGKIMGLRSGDYVQFHNNSFELDRLIIERAEPIVDFCTEKGLDIDSDEARKAIYEEGLVWLVSKAQPVYDKFGKPLMVSVRMSDKEKMEYIAENGAEVVSDPTMLEILLNRAQSAGVTVEVELDEEGNEVYTEQGINTLISFIELGDVEFPTQVKFPGGKLASSSKTITSGCNLSASDNAVWTQVKSNLTEKEALSVNRIFKYADRIENIEWFNGFENVTLKGYVIEFLEDRPVTRIGQKA